MLPRLANVLVSVLILATCLLFMGCPNANKTGINGSWVFETSDTVEGVTIAQQTMWKFDGGEVMFVNGARYSGSGWSSEIRAWIRGTCIQTDDTVQIDFTAATCQDLGVKRIDNGDIPAELAANIQAAEAWLPLQIAAFAEMPAAPLAFVLDGDTLSLAGGDLMARYNDTFDYSDSTTSCEE